MISHGAKPRLYLFHLAKEIDNDLIIPKDDESISFVQGLVARGQATTPRKDGSLPPGATHEIVGMTKTGLPMLLAVGVLLERLVGFWRSPEVGTLRAENIFYHASLLMISASFRQIGQDSVWSTSARHRSRTQQPKTCRSSMTLCSG